MLRMRSGPSLRPSLTALNKEQLVEKSACPGDLSGEGAGLIKGKIIRLMTGPAPGYQEKPLSPSQLAVAQKVYDQICSSRFGATLLPANQQPC